MIYDEGTVNTTPLPEGTNGDKDLKGFKPPADMEPSTTLVADPSRADAKYQALLLSDEELMEESEDDVFEVGDERVKTSILLMKKKLSLHYQTKTSLNHLMHKILNQTFTPLVLKLSRNMTMSCHSLKENWYNIFKKSPRFHDAAYKVHKGTKAAFSTYEKLLVNFQAQYVCTQQHLLSLKGKQLLRGENFTHDATEEPHFYTKGEIDNMETKDTKVEKEPKKETIEEVPTGPTRAVPISTVRPITRTNPEIALIESSSRPPLTNTILEIPIT
nr:hypothetical protein [Tanacetum cinerariifolium]